MHVYSYDDIYQLTAVDYPAGFDYLATDTTFNYDAAGNLVTPDPDPGAAASSTAAARPPTRATASISTPRPAASPTSTTPAAI